MIVRSALAHSHVCRASSTSAHNRDHRHGRRAHENLHQEAVSRLALLPAIPQPDVARYVASPPADRETRREHRPGVLLHRERADIFADISLDPTTATPAGRSRRPARWRQPARSTETDRKPPAQVAPTRPPQRAKARRAVAPANHRPRAARHGAPACGRFPTVAGRASLALQGSECPAPPRALRHGRNARLPPRRTMRARRRDRSRRSAGPRAREPAAPSPAPKSATFKQHRRFRRPPAGSTGRT